MKNILNSLPASFILFLFILNLQSCKNNPLNEKCENIKKKDVYFLFDVTDSLVFKDIQEDVLNNKKNLFKNPLFAINSCESISIASGSLSENESISFSKKDFILDKSPLNYTDEELSKQINGISDSIVLFLDSSIENLKNEAIKPSHNSNITKNILKTILQTNSENATIFIFSDFVENNNDVNMYKSKISNLNPKEYVEQLKIKEPVLLDELSKKNKDNLKLVFLLKPESTKKINSSELKLFWQGLFNELNIKIKIIDNLSQTF